MLVQRISRARVQGSPEAMLDEGVYNTVSAIGDAENISKSYVSRVLRLTLLAPDIING